MKKTITIVVLATINTAAAFVSLWLVFVIVGPGWKTDALFAGVTIPQVLMAVLGGSLQNVLVPILSALDLTERRRVAWGFFLLMAGVFSALYLLLFAAAPLLVPFLVPGFDFAAKELTVDLLRIQAAGVLFTGLSIVPASVYQSQNRFVRPESVSLLTAIPTILLMIALLPTYGVEAAAWLGVARAFVGVVALVPALGPIARPDQREPFYRLFWERFRPLLASTAYFKTGPLVDKFLSSLAGPSGLSLLHVSQQIYDGVGQIIFRAVTSPITLKLSLYAQSGAWVDFRHLYRRYLLIALVVTGTIYLGVLLLGIVLIQVFIQPDRFDEAHLSTLHYLFAALGGYLIAGAMGQILASSFYAKGNTLIPARVGVIGFTLGSILKFVGLLRFGIVGVALAASLHQIFNTSIMYIILDRRMARKK